MGYWSTCDADITPSVWCAFLTYMRKAQQMPAQRLWMRQVREVLRLTWVFGLSEHKIAQRRRVSRPPGAEYVRRAQAAGLSWPLPDTLDDPALEGQLFATAAHPPHSAAPSPWLGHRPSGAQTPGCHLALGVARIPGHHTRRPAVQPILSGVSPVGWDARSRHAAEPPGGRNALCGLRRPDDACRPCPHGGSPRSRELHRRRGSLALYLCRSDLEPASPRLDRVPCPCLDGAGWGAPGRGPRSSPGRREPGPAL